MATFLNSWCQTFSIQLSGPLPTKSICSRGLLCFQARWSECFVPSLIIYYQILFLAIREWQISKVIEQQNRIMKRTSTNMGRGPFHVAEVSKPPSARRTWKSLIYFIYVTGFDFEDCRFNSIQSFRIVSVSLRPASLCSAPSFNIFKRFIFFFHEG